MARPIIIGLAAAAAGLVWASAAAADNTEGMVGNTAVCTTSDGGQTKVYVESGGTFTLTLPDGQQTSGTVADDGSQICYTQTNPSTNDPPVCVSSVDRKVGDTWTVEARGQTQNCSLQAGRQ